MDDYTLPSNRPAVCATVRGRTMAEVRRARDEASAAADLVEVRLDGVADANAAGALEGRRCPVIVTCRARWEGGAFDGPEDARLAILRDAWTLGAEYVDVEAAAGFTPQFLGMTAGARTILSFHDFEGIPADLDARLDHMASTSAAVLKIAVSAATLQDASRVMDVGSRLRGRRFVAIAMGTPGIPTRILAARVGSAWTYAGQGWAPGQVPLDVLRGEYRFDTITPRTRLFGVVGRPVGHSLSPAMHNAAFAWAGIDAVYLPLEAATADDFLAFAERTGLEGASVTAPFKVPLAARAALDATARRAGALNTLKRTSEAWAATNTDLEGFIAPLRDRLQVRGLRASILGSGGAARAVAIALTDAGARVTIHGRDASRAAEVAALVGAGSAGFHPAPGTWDLLVNATPVGTTPRVDDSPVPNAVLDGRLVYDLVYNPPTTRLLRDAARAGCAVLGGLDMLVAQAAAQFAWWTGRRPDTNAMREAAARALARVGAAGSASSPAAHPPEAAGIFGSTTR
jgi:3-dehydroquinate dehydratase/shikimate dehydrogenase